MFSTTFSTVIAPPNPPCSGQLLKPSELKKMEKSA